MAKSKDENPRRALCINIKNNKKHKDFYKYIDNQCWLAKNIYNKGMYDIRQLYIATQKLNNGIEINEQQKEYISSFNTWLENFNKEIEELNKTLKKPQKQLTTLDKFGATYIGNNILCKYIEEGIDYISLRPKRIVKGEEVICGGDIPRGVLKEVLCTDWDNYFKSMSAWFKNPSSFTGKPELPRYKHKTKGRAMLFLNNDLFRIKDNYIVFTPSSGMSQFNGVFKVQLGDFKDKKAKDNDCNAKCIKFIPKNGFYQMQICYSIEVEKEKSISERIISTRVVSIDMGVNRFATVANNIGIEPFAINGQPLKSINHNWNKERARLQSILAKVNDKDYSKQIETITNKRTARINHYIHLSSAYIIKWCLENKIDTLIIGKNNRWKENLKKDKKIKSDKARQNFTCIPFNTLISQLKYKCENNGIKFIETEESYTSGTSFLDNEEPNKEEYDKSRREYRGMFVTNKGELIHADLNGAYQIGRKVNKDFFIHSNNYRQVQVVTVGSYNPNKKKRTN
ncbi:MAG: RNA-guided endonuclease InsQ/TnpB family protein [Peptostreptococcaceae bacterium]